MIDRVGLDSLTPARRAALIYSEAQSALSRQLWQAALGDRGDGDSGTREPSQRGALDALLDRLRHSTEPMTPPRAAMRPAVVRAIPDSVPAEPTPAQTTAPTAAIDGLGPNARHAPALEAAAARTGIPAAALAAIVDAEAGKAHDGSWQVHSRNPRSSAAGLGQFLSRTWEGMAETAGTWLNRQAHARGWIGSDGQVTAASRAPLLALRYDAVASINGIADYARRNLDGLQRAGVSTGGEIGATARLAYLGHHLGLGDAIRFLRHGGLDPARARTLLGAQIGVSGSEQRIAQAGNATAAHRNWLLGYLDHKVRPDHFAGLDHAT